ncbi:NUDIX hydrolase domain-like protein [Aspergillus bertholletiae]|uniref:NUDIX hydrolase domain-like protein n=1 Tax=Aspergillus bertholletiae TaxID=1226010 RepID=A0A5N7B7Q3_9EURO|nr:NUDIX hydrolase domain-like protein [Aspergillus bertholletiae]
MDVNKPSRPDVTGFLTLCPSTDLPLSFRPSSELSDSRSYLTRFSKSNPRLLRIDDVENAFAANPNDSDTAIAEVLRRVSEQVEKCFSERLVGHQTKLSDFRTPKLSHPFRINGIPCFLTVRCVAVAHHAQGDGSSVNDFDGSKPSTQPRILILQRSPDDSGGNMWDVPGGGVDDEGEDGKERALDETPFHGICREVRQETGQELECVNHVLTTRTWCRFKNGELRTHVAFCYVVVRPIDKWGEITLSDEHVDSKWISEDEMKHFEFHGTNEAIVLEAFDYMKKGWKTI